MAKPGPMKPLSRAIWLHFKSRLHHDSSLSRSINQSNEKAGMEAMVAQFMQTVCISFEAFEVAGRLPMSKLLESTGLISSEQLCPQRHMIRLHGSEAYNVIDFAASGEYSSPKLIFVVVRQNQTRIGVIAPRRKKCPSLRVSLKAVLQQIR